MRKKQGAEKELGATITSKPSSNNGSLSPSVFP